MLDSPNLDHGTTSSGGSIHQLAVIVLAVIVGVTTACGGGSAVELPHAEKGQVLVIDSAQGRAFLDSDKRVVLLDVRTVDEYMKGHVVGAQIGDLSNPDRWDFRVEELDPQIPVMVYCRDSDCSADASQRLVDAGFVEVYDLGHPGMWDPKYLPIDKRGKS